ncbi:MAG: amidohydrolase family protein [Gammaproteobacteria bacterium]
MSTPRVIDADGHTYERPDWLIKYIDPKFRGRIGVDANGKAMTIDGREYWKQPPNTFEAIGFTPEVVTKRFGDVAREAFSAPAVVRALDVERIDVSVIYGPLYECWIEGMDPALAAAIARAYSRYLVDYCGVSGGRIVGAAPIPLFDVKTALEELRYAHDELGLRAVWTRPNPIGGRNLGDPYFEPFYDAVESLGLPLSLHEGSGSLMKNVGSERFGDTWFEQHACVHPMEQQLAMLSLIVRGVLERHPRLRVAFLESGASWAPAWLHRLDEHQELVGWKDAPGLTMKPSEYFQRQCFISCEPDEDLLFQVVEVLGDRNVVFSTDFPHPDSKYPNAVNRFMRIPKVDDATKRKILWDNALAFYGFDAAAMPHSGAAAAA